MPKGAVMHMAKQASLNLSGMADKKRVELEKEEVEELVKDLVLFEPINNKDPSFIWGEQASKPDLLEGTIAQIKALFDVGSEVAGWSVQYYAPPKINDRKATHSNLVIPAVANGLAGRFIIVVGSREVPTLQVAVGSSGAENHYMLLSGDCMFLKITICPVLNIVFSNSHSEKLPARKGFRETIIKKTLSDRHIFVVDAHVNMTTLADKVKKEFINLSAEKKTTDDVNLVASLASSEPKVSEAPESKVIEETKEVSVRQNSQLSGEIENSNNN
jgi:hypothetical protein